MDNYNYTTAVTSIPSRRMFARYFRARWQNMQNVVNDTAFFAMLPPRFLTYYRAYIEQWLAWARGFVPQLHRGDFFSMGMGYTVCDIYARECMSGGWRIDSRDTATAEFFEDYGQRNEFETLFNEMFFYANAGGNAMLVLTPQDGEVYPMVIPVNRYIFTIGRTKDISNAIIFNRFTTSGDGYVATENRLTISGKSYYCVCLYRGSGNALSPTWKRTEGLRVVPEEVQTQWEYCYGDIKPGEWYTMPPALGIGLFNVKNKSVAAAIADLPGYSDSTLHTALDILYAIDYNYTSQQMDMYWGRTRILLPQEMTARGISTLPLGYTPTNANGAPTTICTPTDDIQAAAETRAQLDDDIYCKVVDNQSVDGRPIQPEFIQPDLRGEAHKYIRDADLEALASKTGLSSATLANHLAYTQTKTATQVDAEEDATAKSVNNKRNLAKEAIDAMLKAIARFYGLSDDVHIVWNKYASNTPTENTTLLSDLQNGAIPKREYIRRRYPTLTDTQIDEWLAELQSEEPPMVRDYNLGGF